MSPRQPADPGVVPTTFRTDHLDVFPKENRARTDALVTMTRPGMEQSGVGFEVDSKNNTYHFLSQSRAVTRPDADSAALLRRPRTGARQAATHPPPVSRAAPPVERTPMKIPFAAVLALGLLVPSAAFAKSTDRNENMNIDSGAQSGVLTGDGKTVLSQGVTVTQGSLDIRSSEAEIYLKDGEAVRAVFTGKQATMKQQLDDGTWMDAVADRIDYDIKTEIITPDRQLQVTSARGTNAGQRMVYNTVAAK